MNQDPNDRIADSLLQGKVGQWARWELGKGVERIVARLSSDDSKRPDADSLCLVLTGLNKQRLFFLAVSAGRTFLSFEPKSCGLRRRFCQALIDSGALDEAELELGKALEMDNCSPKERSELQGLQGRLNKQRYIQRYIRLGDSDPVLLHSAIDHYLSVFDTDPKRPYWHGVNVVALLCRAERDGIPHQRGREVRTIAEQLLSNLELDFAQGKLDLWGIGTVAELKLALAQSELAELWLYRYVSDSNIEPFHLASTLRQFREVWGLDTNMSDFGRLVLILERALARTGVVKLPVSEAADPVHSEHSARSLEKVLGKERFFGFDWWRQGLETCEAVGRVETDAAVGVGTGFLVNGCQLSPKLPDRPVFITNAHVISSSVERALRPDQAWVRFEVLNRRDPTKYVPLAVEEVLWLSEPGMIGQPSDPLRNCDTTIVTLRGLPEDARCVDIAPNLPRLSETSRAYIIGHPDGDGLQFSLHDSELLDIDDTKKLVHYRSPTVGGSSGSPVFNGEWKVFALHHAGAEDMPRFRVEGTYAANEGVSMDCLKRAIDNELAL